MTDLTKDGKKIFETPLVASRTVDKAGEPGQEIKRSVGTCSLAFWFLM